MGIERNSWEKGVANWLEWADRDSVAQSSSSAPNKKTTASNAAEGNVGKDGTQVTAEIAYSSDAHPLADLENGGAAINTLANALTHEKDHEQVLDKQESLNATSVGVDPSINANATASLLMPEIIEVAPAVSNNILTTQNVHSLATDGPPLDNLQQRNGQRFRELQQFLINHRDTGDSVDICTRQLDGIAEASPSQQKARLKAFANKLYACSPANRLVLTEMLALKLSELTETKQIALSIMKPVLMDANERAAPILQRVLHQLMRIRTPVTQRMVIKLVKENFKQATPLNFPVDLAVDMVRSMRHLNVSLVDDSLHIQDYAYKTLKHHVPWNGLNRDQLNRLAYALQDASHHVSRHTRPRPKLLMLASIPGFLKPFMGDVTAHGDGTVDDGSPFALLEGLPLSFLQRPRSLQRACHALGHAASVLARTAFPGVTTRPLSMQEEFAPDNQAGPSLSAEDLAKQSIEVLIGNQGNIRAILDNWLHVPSDSQQENSVKAQKSKVAPAKADTQSPDGMLLQSLRMFFTRLHKLGDTPEARTLAMRMIVGEGHAMREVMDNLSMLLEGVSQHPDQIRIVPDTSDTQNYRYNVTLPSLGEDANFSIILPRALNLSSKQLVGNNGEGTSS